MLARYLHKVSYILGYQSYLMVCVLRGRFHILHCCYLVSILWLRQSEMLCVGVNLQDENKSRMSNSGFLLMACKYFSALTAV